MTYLDNGSDGTVTPEPTPTPAPTPAPMPTPAPQPSPEMTPSPAATSRPSTTPNAQPTPLPPGVEPAQGEPSQIAQLCYSVIMGFLKGLEAAWNAVEVEVGLGSGFGFEGEVDPLLSGSALVKADMFYMKIIDGQISFGTEYTAVGGCLIGGYTGLQVGVSVFHPYFVPCGHGMTSSLQEIVGCEFAEITPRGIIGQNHSDGSQVAASYSVGGSAYLVVGGTARFGFHCKEFFEDIFGG